MEKLITDIIEKVRLMYKYDNSVNYLVKSSPKIILDYYDELRLRSISFSYYDTLTVYKDSIVFSPEHGTSKTLITYNGFDELLKL